MPLSIRSKVTNSPHDLSEKKKYLTSRLNIKLYNYLKCNYVSVYQASLTRFFIKRILQTQKPNSSKSLREKCDLKFKVSKLNCRRFCVRRLRTSILLLRIAKTMKRIDSKLRFRKINSSRKYIVSKILQTLKHKKS